MEETACQICGLKRSVKIFTVKDYLTGDRFDLVRCQGCSFCFVDPQPSSDEMARYYPSFYYGDRRSFFEWITCYLRARRVENAYGRGKPGSLLDVGCSRR